MSDWQDAAWRPRGNVWLVAGAATLAPFMEILDTTIVNVSLPNIAGALSASNDDATWTLTSYLVANGIVVPVAGWLGRLIGRKRYFLICIAMFTVCSFLCGIATSLPQLVVFRLLQGLFGGGLQPSQQSVILDTFAPSQRGEGVLAGGDRGDLRADHRAGARRLDHRRLFLALGVPDQRAGRDLRVHRRGATGGGSALGAARPRASARHRLWRTGADRARAGLAADHAGPRRGQRLVQFAHASSCSRCWQRWGSSAASPGC